MAKNIKVRVNTGNEESNKTFDIAQGNDKTANPTRIKAVKGARYHLEDPAAKNVGPENIRSKRVGKDLHVMLDGSNEVDLIVEGYYDEAMLSENNRGLYGRAEDGKMFEYIPEDPTLEGMPINLADGGRPVSQVLGGVPIGEAFELSGLVLVAAGGGFGGLAAGAAAVGAAALAGGGGGGGGGAVVTGPAATALASIKAAAEANNATDTNVAASVFATAGITGVDANNVAAIQSALNDADVQSGQADTAAKVQTVVDAYNAIKANADSAATTNPTQAQYAAIGVNGVDSPTKEKLLGDAIDGKAFADVDTVAKVQALADAAAAVMTGAAGGTAPTQAQLAALGITGVTQANLAAVQAAIAATENGGTGVDTLSELQAVVTSAANAAGAAALSTISAAAQANNATDANVATGVFATAGVTGVDSTNVAAIQSALNSAAVIGTSADTAVKVQAVVDAYKAILAEANDTANTAGNGTADANPASNPTAAQYAAIGVNLGSATTDAATDAETLGLLNAIVGGKQAADVSTVDEVQALATIANAIQLKAAGGTPSPALTIADLQKIGLDTTGVTTDNLPTLLAAIAAKSDTGSETDTLEKLQAIIGTLDKVAPVAVNDTNSANENTVTQTGNVKTNDTSLDNTETFALVGSNVGTYGTLTLGTNGAYTYTYGTGIHAITANVTDTFTYRVTDAAGNTSTATLAVTVTPVNDAATFSGDISKATTETDVAQTITGQLTVADVDSATTVVAQTSVAGSAGLGNFTINSTGAWSYVMNNAQNQLKPTDVITDSLTVSTADGTTQTISVVITGANDAAVISGTTTGTVVEASGVANAITGTPTASGTLTSADVDGTANLFTAVTAGTASGSGKGTYGMTTAGVWTYTVDNNNATVQALAAGASTTDTFTVTAADGTAQVVTVTITGANDAAVIGGTSTGTVVEAGGVGNAAAGTPTASGTLTSADVDGTVNLFTAVTAGTASTGGKGTYAMTTAGAWTYTVDNTIATVQALGANASTTDTFSVTAADGTAQVVTVTITGANDTPTGAVTISGNAAVGSVLTATATTVADVDGLNAFSYSWYANGTAISGATGTTYTLVSGDVGKTITAKVSYTDGGGTAETVTSSATAAVTAVTPGQAVVDLGTSGKLIAPVQVEGKWYYFWDRSGDGTSANTGSLNGGTDQVSHDVLDSIFKYDINGNLNPNAGTNTDNTYRYATINGVQLAMPTVNGAMTFTPGIYHNGTAATGQGTTNNSSYDELMAIWDAFNGTVTTNSLSGLPTGWGSGYIWSATPSSFGHAAYVLSAGTDANQFDGSNYYSVLEVVKANAAPVLDASASPTLTGVSAGAAAPVNGSTTGSDLVSSLVTGITDADSGATKGIAITGVHAGATLYYSVDGGTTWLTATGVSDTNALLLAADANTRVFYQANGTSGTITDALTLRAWDMTANITEGVYTDTTPRGGKAQFSTATDTVGISVTDPLLATACAATINSQGNSTTVIRANFTNASFANATIRFYVGSTLYETATLNGTGFYFQTIDMPTSFGSIVHAEVVKNGVTYVIGGGLQIGANGNPTNAYYASPLVLDLNGDGVQTTDATHGVQFDLSNSGKQQQTSWVEKHDGLLAIDLNGDGQVNSGAELFGNSTKLPDGSVASNGWAALAALDSNHDGKIDAQDAGFDKLRVWVDADSDAVTDAGELHTLAEVKVQSIDLNADSTIAYQNGNVLQGLSSYQSTDGTTHEVVDVWFQVTGTGVMPSHDGENLDLSNVSNLSLVTGVTEAGQTTAETADGSSMLLADALFAFNALDYNVDGHTLNLLGSHMTLDLSSILAMHHDVTEVDLTGSGTNTLKLNLTDVLSVATDASIANGVHKLTLTGDANDTVQLDLSQWANTGTTVTEGDHTYAVYNASSAAAAQLLIDQHMVLANHA